MECVTQCKNVKNVEESRKNQYLKDSSVASLAGTRLIEITKRL